MEDIMNTKKNRTWVFVSVACLLVLVIAAYHAENLAESRVREKELALQKEKEATRKTEFAKLLRINEEEKQAAEKRRREEKEQERLDKLVQDLAALRRESEIETARLFDKMIDLRSSMTRLPSSTRSLYPGYLSSLESTQRATHDPDNPPAVETKVIEKYRGAIIVSHDTLTDKIKYLGMVADKYNAESIFNEYGLYGSKYSLNSIWNEYGTYGGKYSMDSPFNKYSINPPIIVKDKQIIGHLTVNKAISDGIDPLSLKASFLSKKDKAEFEKNGKRWTQDIRESPATVVAPPIKSAPRNVITAIALGDNPLAMIGDSIVHQGDIIGGATVVKIEKGKVHFEKDGKTWTAGIGQTSKPHWE